MTEFAATTGSAFGSRARRYAAQVGPWLLLFAVAWYGWRGPAAAWSASSDFALVYAQARVWLSGGNPYDHPSLLAAMRDGDVDAPATFDRQRWPAIYPPSMHPLIAPLAAMSWPAAKTLWLVINVAATLGLIMVVTRLAELRGPPALLLAVFVLVFAPLHSGIAKGQLALLSLLFALTAWWCILPHDRVCAAGGDRRSSRHRAVLAGMLLGVGVALKPQIAGVVWLLLVWRRQHAVAALAVGVTLIVTAIGAAWLWAHDVAWIDALRRNLADNAAAGASGDPTAANPLRFQLINLHYLAGLFVGDRPVLIAWTVRVAAALIVLPALWFAQRRRHVERGGAGDAEFTFFGVLGAVSLLAVYHRAYDVVLLLPLAAWAIKVLWGAGLSEGNGGRRPRAIAWVSLWLMLVFLGPGGALPQYLTDKGLVPCGVAETWAWRVVVMPHQVWALLALALALVWLLGLAAAGRESQVHREPPRPPHA